VYKFSSKKQKKFAFTTIYGKHFISQLDIIEMDSSEAEY